MDDDKKFVHIRINPNDTLIKEVLIERGYEHYKDSAKEVWGRYW